MMRAIHLLACSFAMAALLAGPAFAQAPNINLMPEVQSKTPDEIERDQQRDKAYRESLRKIPDAKGSNDPWGNVRGNEAARDAAKAPAKPKPAPKRAKADIPPN